MTFLAFLAIFYALAALAFCAGCYFLAVILRYTLFRWID